MKSCLLDTNDTEIMQKSVTFQNQSVTSAKSVSPLSRIVLFQILFMIGRKCFGLGGVGKPRKV
jgi:hypothetical protein